MTNDVAIITGAGSGIGRAIALRLASSGWHVVVADRDPNGGRETVRLVGQGGANAVWFEVDVASTESVSAFRSWYLDRFEAPSVLVNCAGWDRTMPFLETTPEFWAQVVGINYLGTVAMCHAFLREMVDHRVRGHVVNIGSDAGRVGSSGETVYAGAKGAVISFTKSLAREMARHEINVNCVCPGPTDTPLFYEQPERIREALVRAVPLRRLGSPDDVAGAVSFLVSDQASYITGQVLSVSGGLTMAG